MCNKIDEKAEIKAASNSENKEGITLKSVLELDDNGKTQSFLIPEYQRGYRWDARQVDELIKDILDFQEKKKKDDEIYCIQPLVVKECDEDGVKTLKVVDGQQRLTTMYLLLSYIKNTTSVDFDVFFTIKYKTRKESKKYLEQLAQIKDFEKEKKNKIDGKTLEELSNENIDFYHMFEAMQTICESNDVRTIKKETLERVKFIWYPIAGDDLAVFKDLNIGKIKLTEAELIKALFLNESNCKLEEKEKNEISEMWNTIEYSLQNDELWYFLHQKEKTDNAKATRIEFILDLIFNNNELYKVYKENKNDAKKIKSDIEEMKGVNVPKTFLYFNEHFKNINKPNSKENPKGIILKIWQEIICRYYYTLNEWYHDYKLYHYIGYLSSMNEDSTKIISDLVKKWYACSNKADFAWIVKLKIIDVLINTKWIQDKVKSGAEWYEYQFDQEQTGMKGKLKEESKKSNCKCILLLHNIETIVRQNEKLIQDSKYNLPNFTKFPFHLYKKEHWDIEHISSNSGDDFENLKDQKLFLLHAKDYSDDDIKNQIDAFVNDDPKHNGFTEIWSKMTGDQLVGKADKNQLQNFTLLDRSTNREYQNAIFPVKREFLHQKENGYKIKYDLNKDNKLIETDRTAEVAFVPVCTKNVFDKHYTKDPTMMCYWTETDAESYLEDIKNKTGPFMNYAVLFIRENIKADGNKPLKNEDLWETANSKNTENFKVWALKEAKYALRDIKSLIVRDSIYDLVIERIKASTILRNNYKEFINFQINEVSQDNEVIKKISSVCKKYENTNNRRISMAAGTINMAIDFLTK